MVKPINLGDSSITVPDSITQLIPNQSNSQDVPIEEATWISSYYIDFKKRMLHLLGFEFRSLSCSLGFQFIGEKNQNQGQAGEANENQALIDQIDRAEVEQNISVYDLRRLESYSNNMVDFHLILDLVPTLSKLFFLKQTLPRGSVNLSYVQQAILIGLGLQYKKVEDLEQDLGLNSAQILP